MSVRSKKYPFAVLALALGIAACSEAPSAPTADLSAKVASTIGAPTPELWHEVVWVCKIGSDASFAVSVNGAAPVNHSVADGECEGVFTHTGNREDGFMVTVTELDIPGTVLDRIVVETTRFEQITDTRVVTDSRSVTVESIQTKGAIITFYNTPVETPPGGGEGCTPGYWKQRHHFDSWTGFSPDQLFSSVFEDAFPGKTLVQVLGAGGGGLNALGRHTVAALLNASSAGVDYDVATPADVIAQFNAVFPSSNYETLKNRFEGFNEQGCPLN